MAGFFYSPGMDTTLFFGLAAGILTATSMLPQLIKLIKTKEAKDLSSFSFIVLITGLALWVTYCFMIGNLPIIATNSFSFLVNLTMLVLAVRYKK